MQEPEAAPGAGDFFSSCNQQQTQEETMSALRVVGALRRERCSGMQPRHRL